MTCLMRQAAPVMACRSDSHVRPVRPVRSVHRHGLSSCLLRAWKAHLSGEPGCACRSGSAVREKSFRRDECETRKGA